MNDKASVPSTRSKFSAKTIIHIVLLICIIFRIYKALAITVVNDEIWTYFAFATDIHTALTKFTSTNNHLLNSLIMSLMKNSGIMYSQLIRIPTLICSIVFCWSVYRILTHTVRTRYIIAIFLAGILLNRTLCDYSFLARGYAYSLMSFSLILMILVKSWNTGADSFLLKKRCTALVVLLNFISLGALSSSLTFIFALNVVYLIGIIKNSSKEERLKQVLFNVTALAIGTGALTVLFYWQVIPKLIDQANSFGDRFNRNRGLYKYLTLILFDPFITKELWLKQFTRAVGYAFFAYIPIATALTYRKLYKASKFKDIAIYISNPIVLTFFITLTVMAIQRHVLGVSLGMPRNSLYLLLLFMLLLAILFDVLTIQLSSKHILPKTGIIMLVFLFMVSASSPLSFEVYEVGIFRDGMTKKFLTQLHQIDPAKQWRIKYSERIDFIIEAPCRYYNLFGYNNITVDDNSYDLYICRDTEIPENTTLAEFCPEIYNYYHCQIFISPKCKEIQYTN